ncbi:unnamed protein product [Ilex paraguariensis]|uniref:Protein kinase domain-containing protein n=1 Tax=Ilex paraguariensis TaxID=185542 RepID=A0ABC8UYW6_9AQUA
MAGFQPNAIVVEEANHAKANWIVMDRSFARDDYFHLSETNCNFFFVSADEVAVVYKYSHHGPETSEAKYGKSTPKCSKLISKSLYQQEVLHIHWTTPNYGGDYNQSFHPSLLASGKDEICREIDSSEQRENVEKGKSPWKETVLKGNIYAREFSEVNLLLRVPVQLSWEVILSITSRTRCMVFVNQSEDVVMYSGCLTDCQRQVTVTKFTGDFYDVVEAEKKAAMSIYHKNILGLMGYHRNENSTFLVFPSAIRGPLDIFLNGSKGKQAELAFREKMKIAVGIAQGVRYMHDENPLGPIVHGDLRPCNIYLTYDFQPLITSFGKATWLQQEHSSAIANNRCWHKDRLDPKSLASVKSDIFSFGVLLVRLFCRRSAPQDDKKLVEWARPLLSQRAYHKLLDEEVEDVDMYGMYKLVCAASLCIKTKPLSRSCMSEVISFLTGETYCAMQSSPSSEGSPVVDLKRESISAV